MATAVVVSIGTFIIGICMLSVSNWVTRLENRDDYISWKVILLASFCSAIVMGIISYVIISIDRDLFFKLL